MDSLETMSGQSNDDFITVSYKSNGKKKHDNVEKASIQPKPIAHVSDYQKTNCSDNRKINYTDEVSKVQICRKRNISFQINILSEVKKIVRDAYGIYTNHEAHTSTAVSRQCSNNKVILDTFIAKASRNRRNCVSFMLFACQQATKIDNDNLLDMISNYIITTYGMTIEEILDARYQDDQCNLIIKAAWNNSESCLRWCVMKGADINFVHNNNEGQQEKIGDVLTAGRNQRLAIQEENKKNNKPYNIDGVTNRYNACAKFINDTKLRIINEKAKAVKENDVMIYKPTKATNTNDEHTVSGNDVFVFTKNKNKANKKKPKHNGGTKNVFEALGNFQEELEEKSEVTKISQDNHTEPQVSEKAELAKIYQFDNEGKEFADKIAAEAIEKYDDDNELIAELQKSFSIMTIELQGHLKGKLKGMGIEF